jgi:hypothetical protein
MKKSSGMYKQIVKAQKAMKSWPKELTHDLVIIPVEEIPTKETFYTRKDSQTLLDIINGKRRGSDE